MKERPILMSTPMVRALLDGSKTQTRRMVKAAPVEAGSVAVVRPWSSGETATTALFFEGATPESRALAGIRCPYGVPGDRLWVREAFYDHNHGHGHDLELVEYRATQWDRDTLDFDAAWKPSIHMPRWASRLTLEITDVRVERLQAISVRDAVAEGVQGTPGNWHNYAEPAGVFANPVDSYRTLWEQINGQGSWDLNPWAWAVSFRVVQP